MLSNQSVVLLSLVQRAQIRGSPRVASVLDRTVVVIQNLWFQIVTMVNSDGFLEEEDSEVSYPRNRGHDTSFPRDD